MSTNTWHDASPARASTEDQSGQAVYSIGDLAADLGVSSRAIRFYEDQGMLAPLRVGGNRVYSQRDLARLKLILRGKRLGFSLSDIRELLDLYYVDHDHLEQMNQTLQKGRARIAELEQQLGERIVTMRVESRRDQHHLRRERVERRQQRPSHAEPKSLRTRHRR